MRKLAAHFKHHAGWQLRRDPGDHTSTWTSTTGHRYPVAHHDHRSFATLASAPAVRCPAAAVSAAIQTDVKAPPSDYPCPF
jgi:hypothetical protein